MSYQVHNYFLIAPGIPSNLFVNEINSTAITVSWVQPAVTNGIITMYEIVYAPGNHSALDDDATVVPVTATANTSYEIVIIGLDHFTIYTIVVRAFTRLGAGNLTETFSILTDPYSKSSCVICAKYILSRVYNYKLLILLNLL